MILKPMASTGKDAVWSMGDDTPLAFLAKSPRPLYAFFRQRFAQVTNPPIDSLRESVVVSLHTRLGPWPHLLEKNAPLPGIALRVAVPVAGTDGGAAQGRVSAQEGAARRGAGVLVRSGADAGAGDR